MVILSSVDLSWLTTEYENLVLVLEVSAPVRACIGVIMCPPQERTRRRSISIILHEMRDKTDPGRPKPNKLYSESGMAKLVRRLRNEAGCRRRSLSMIVGMVE